MKLETTCLLGKVMASLNTPEHTGLGPGTLARLNTYHDDLAVGTLKGSGNSERQKVSEVKTIPPIR